MVCIYAYFNVQGISYWINYLPTRHNIRARSYLTCCEKFIGLSLLHQIFRLLFQLLIILGTKRQHSSLTMKDVNKCLSYWLFPCYHNNYIDQKILILAQNFWLDISFSWVMTYMYCGYYNTNEAPSCKTLGPLHSQLQLHVVTLQAKPATLLAVNYAFYAYTLELE